jgi:predicted DNA-binding helix-hairpin-helix protein
MLLKILPFALTQVLCQNRLYRADHAYLTYLMLQRELSQMNGLKLDHRQIDPYVASALTA